MFVESTTASSRLRTRALDPLAAGILLGLAALPSARAATIVVTTPGDTGVANTCTLRQAILSMNTSTLSGNCANSGAAFGTNDTINFAPAINTVTLADTPNNTLQVQARNLKIDAGVGRVVAIERPLAALNPFSVITAQTGYGGTQLGTRSNGNLQLIGLTIRNGVADNDLFTFFGKYDGRDGPYTAGGGLATNETNVTLDRCNIQNNRAEFGGGVSVFQGHLTIRSSTISGNTASKEGGGVSVNPGEFRMHDSVLSQNVVSSGSWGGGGASLMSSAGVEIVNSTISGNITNTVTSATAVRMVNPRGSLSLINSTLACNRSALSGIPNGEAVLIRKGAANIGVSAISTIFADTSNTRCTTLTEREIRVQGGQIPVGGSNNLVVGNSAIDSSAQFSIAPLAGDPELGALQNNGGSTATHALPASSPAINQGSNPGNLVYDQRGADFSRSTGRSPDIGAFEYPYAGLCGAAHGGAFLGVNVGTPNLCNAGAFLQDGLVFGTGPWSWFCAANGNPGNNEFCGAKVLSTVGLAVTNAGGTPITSAIYGQPVKLKATVAGSVSAPTGTVSFFDTSNPALPLCVDVPLVNNAGVVSATCNVPANAIRVGARLLKSSYGGNGTYGAASDSGVALSVQPAATTTVISSHTPSPVMTGSPYTVVAQVTVSAPSVATPLGIVEVRDQTDNLVCSYFVDTLPAGCAITPITAGTHNLQVTFGADPNLLNSSAAATHTVVNPPVDIFKNGFEP